MTEGAYVVPVGGPQMTHEHCSAWEDAGVEVAYQWHQFARATTPLMQASALVALSNAMSDLRSWLPGYDGDSDTMPWERGEDPESPNDDSGTSGGAE